MNWLSENREFICDLAGNIFGLGAAIVAVFGDTYDSDSKRITIVGILAIVLAMLGFGTTTLSSTMAANDAQKEQIVKEQEKAKDEIFRASLFADLQAANRQISTSNASIESLVATVKELAEELKSRNNKRNPKLEKILLSTDSISNSNDSSTQQLKGRLDSSFIRFNKKK